MKWKIIIKEKERDVTWLLSTEASLELTAVEIIKMTKRWGEYNIQSITIINNEN